MLTDRTHPETDPVAEDPALAAYWSGVQDPSDDDSTREAPPGTCDQCFAGRIPCSGFTPCTNWHPGDASTFQHSPSPIGHDSSILQHKPQVKEASQPLDDIDSFLQNSKNDLLLENFSLDDSIHGVADWISPDSLDRIVQEATSSFKRPRLESQQLNLNTESVSGTPLTTPTQRDATGYATGYTDHTKYISPDLTPGQSEGVGPWPQAVATAISSVGSENSTVGSGEFQRRTDLATPVSAAAGGQALAPEMGYIDNTAIGSAPGGISGRMEAPNQGLGGPTISGQSPSTRPRRLPTMTIGDVNNFRRHHVTVTVHLIVQIGAEKCMLLFDESDNHIHKYRLPSLEVGNEFCPQQPYAFNFPLTYKDRIQGMYESRFAAKLVLDPFPVAQFWGPKKENIFQIAYCFRGESERPPAALTAAQIISLPANLGAAANTIDENKGVQPTDRHFYEYRIPWARDMYFLHAYRKLQEGTECYDEHFHHKYRSRMINDIEAIRRARWSV